MLSKIQKRTATAVIHKILVLVRINFSFWGYSDNIGRLGDREWYSGWEVVFVGIGLVVIMLLALWRRRIWSLTQNSVHIAYSQV